MESPPSARRILEAVAAGRMSPAEAESALRSQSVADLGFATLDLQRTARRGAPEAIFCEGKTTDQVIAIARRMHEAGQNALLTRLLPEQTAAVLAAFPAERLTHNAIARLIHLRAHPVERRAGLVAILAAGTSDLPVAEEAAATAEALGSPVERAFDVGVAGLHRLLARADLLTRARAIVVVAGMDGALPSVVGGLVSAPVIAVPTSVGYGAAFGGLAPLLTMLNSCSPGVAVVNIDNGYGAGYLADRINAMTTAES